MTKLLSEYNGWFLRTKIDDHSTSFNIYDHTKTLDTYRAIVLVDKAKENSKFKEIYREFKRNHANNRCIVRITATLYKEETYEYYCCIDIENHNTIKFAEWLYITVKPTLNKSARSVYVDI